MSDFDTNSASRVNRLVRSMNQETPENSALGSAVRWNLHFGSKHYQSTEDQGRYNPKFNRDTERAYIHNYSREYEEADISSRPSTTLGKVIGDTLAENAFSAFNKQEHSVTADSRASLKRLTNNFFIGDSEEDSTFASQNVFKYVYKNYLDGERVVTRESFDSNSVVEGGSEYLRELGADHLRNMVNADISGAFATVGRIESEIDRLSMSGQGLRRAKQLINNGEGNTLVNNQTTAKDYYRSKVANLDSEGRYRPNVGEGATGYINRPGILPFIQLIENSNNVIVIDSFQFQNKAISDYMFDAIVRKTKENPNFKVTIRLAAPRESIGGEGTVGQTGYSIHGPNIIEIQKFAELNQRLKDELNLQDDVIAFNTQDKRYHPKLYYTDQIAAIGTANITSPMGRSINQSGSNFETMRFVQNRIQTDTELKIARKDYGNKDREEKRDVIETLLHRQLTALVIDKEDKDYDHREHKFIERRGQIGLAGDIYEHLDATINYVHNSRQEKGGGYINVGGVTAGKSGVFSKLSMFIVLDQTMLLQYDSSLYKESAKGEMGHESTEVQKTLSDINSTRHSAFRKTQSKLFDLLAEDRAFVTVDSKNYNEQVFNPMMKKLKNKAVITSGANAGKSAYEIFEKYDFDIEKLVGQGFEGIDKDLATGRNVNVNNQRLNKIKSQEEKLKYLFGDDSTFDNSFRKQLIAMSSGNIRMASVPRQHVKSYAVMERDESNKLTMQSYYLGSSNLGPYSLAMKGIDNRYTSEEYGLLLAIEDINKYRSQMQSNKGPIDLTSEILRNRRLEAFQIEMTENDYSLDAEQERDEMQNSQRHFISTWTQLGNNSITSTNFKEVNNNPMWERSVSNKQLTEMAGRLEAMKTTLGASSSALSFKYKQNAIGTREVSLLVTLDTASLAGLGVGKDAPTVGGTKFQFEMTVLKGATDTDPGTVLFVGQNKLIAEALFVNSSGMDISMIWGRESSKGNKPEQLSRLGEYKLASGASAHLSSMDTAMHILGTLAGEGVFRTLLYEPKEIWQSMNQKERDRALTNYISSLALGTKDGEDAYKSLTKNDKGTWQALIKLSEDVHSRYGGESGIESLENARRFGNILDRELNGKDSNDIANNRGKLLETLSGGIRDIANSRTLVEKEAALTQTRATLERMMTVFPELLLDVIDKQNNPVYTARVKNNMHDFLTGLLDPHQMTSQERTRGGAVDSNRMILLGTNSSEVAKRMNMASNGNGESSLTNIGLYYRSIGLEYGPTSDIYEYLYRGIADGASNSEEYVGSDFSFVNKKARGYGEATKLEVFESLGVGRIVYKKQAEEYIKSIEERYVNTNRQVEFERIKSSLLGQFGEGETEASRLLTFHTGTTEKIAQLPQRLKNAMGARPLYKVSAAAQRIYENPDAPGYGMGRFLDGYLYATTKDRVDKEGNPVLNKHGYAIQDIDELGYRKKLERRVRDLRKSTIANRSKLGEEAYFNQMDLYDRALQDWFTDDYKIGAIFDEKISKVLSNEQAEFIEIERKRIMDTLGIKDEESFQKDETAKELLRVNALLAGLGSQKLGKMVGGNDRHGTSIAIIQLTGAYTDTALGNAEYGSMEGLDGQREGYLDSYRKSVKSSMIGVGGYDESFYQEHDLIKRDKRTNKYVVHRKGKKEEKLIVNKGGTLDLVGNIIENANYSASGVEGSVARIQGTAYTRAGEDSIEHLFNVGWRQGGSFETSQMTKMYRVVRSLKMSGGRRIEGTDSGVLAKAVMNFASRERYSINVKNVDVDGNVTESLEELNLFEYIAKQKTSGLRSGEIGGSFGVYANQGIDHRRISGLYNPNNFKSFFFSHGSVILRSENGEMLNRLFNTTGLGNKVTAKSQAQKAAAAIVMNFGTDFLYKGQSNTTKAKASLNMKKTLLSAATQGDLGYHYQAIAAVAQMLNNENDAAEALFKGSSMNLLTTPELAGLNPEDLMKILSGTASVSENEAFLRTVRNMVDLGTPGGSKGYFREYLNLGKTEHIQAAVLVSAIDFMHQVAEDRSLLEIGVDINFKDAMTRERLRSVVGITDEKWDKDPEKIIAMIQGMSTRVVSLMAHIDLSGSQSKDPTGAHLKGKTESQHLMRPMMTQIQEFEKTGSVGKITNVIAGLTAAIAQNSPLQYYGHESIENITSANILNKHTASNPFFKRNFLGIYASELAPEEFQTLAKQYKDITSTYNTDGKEGSLAVAYASGDYRLVQKEMNLLAELEHKMAMVQSQFGAYEGKTSGTTYARTVIGAMTNKRFAFSLNDISAVRQGEMYTIKVDKTRVIHSFLPSGNDLETLGVQWGDFVDDFVNNTKEILRGFAPGTRVSNILDKLRANPDGGVVITAEEQVELTKFMVAVQEQMKLLSYTIAGTRVQAASGGKNAFDGMVSTGVASWLVPSSQILLPSEATENAGLARPAFRVDFLNEIDDSLKLVHAELDAQDVVTAPFYDKLREAKQQAKANKTRFSLSSTFSKKEIREAAALAAVIGETRGTLIRQKVFEDLQSSALIHGISSTANIALEKALEDSANLEKQFNKIVSSNDTESQKIGKLNAFMEQTAKKEREFKAKGTYQEGDRFVRHAIFEEFRLWNSKAYNYKYELEKDSKVHTVFDTRRYQRNQKDITAFESLAIGFAGFRNIGTTNKAVPSDGRLFEGGIAGNLKTNLVDVDEIKGLKGTQQGEYVKRRVSELKTQFEEFQQNLRSKTLARRGYIRGSTDSTQQVRNREYEHEYDVLNESSERRITELIDGLEKIKTEMSLLPDIDEKLANRYLNQVNRLISVKDATNVTGTTTHRPPPPGGTEHGLGLFRTIESVYDLNQYAKVAGERSGVMTLMFDEIRNKGVTYLNPIGIHTMGLGDYDGDSYVSIFNYMSLADKEIGKAKGARTRHEIMRDSAAKERQGLSEKILHSVGNVDEKDLERLNNLDEKIATHNKIIKEQTEKIGHLKGRVAQHAEDVTNRTIGAARREFANYMGVDQRHLVSKEEDVLIKGKLEKGWGDRTVDIDTLHVFLEQGQGLFSGLKGQGSKATKVMYGMDKLIDFHTTIEQTARYYKNVTHDQVKEKVVKLIEGKTVNKGDDGYEVIKRIYDDANAKAGEGKGIVAAVASQMAELGRQLDKLNPQANKTSEELVKEQAARWSGTDLYSRLIGHSELTSLVAKGSGMTVDDSTFDGLLKTLGNAGGDILGKTYNSLIGTMFADSPMISLGHAITKNSVIEKSVIKHIDKMSLGFGGEEFVGQVKEAMDFSEGLQGYMKNVHQLLRDSIKFKGDAGMTDKLKELAEQYNKGSLSEEEKSSLVHKMAQTIGPGMGIVGLTRLDSLTKLSYTKGGVSKDNLLNEFDIDANKVDGNLQRLASRVGYDSNELINAVNLQNNDVASEIWTKIARYRTSEDMLHLVTAYRYEKNIGAGNTWVGRLKSNAVNTYNSMFHGAKGVANSEAVERHLEMLYTGEVRDDKGKVIQTETNFNDVNRARHREALAAKLGLGDDIYTYDDKNNITGLKSSYQNEVRKLMNSEDGALQVFDQVYNETKRETEPFLKKDGSGLTAFASQNAIRSSMSRAFAGDTGSEADIAKHLEIDASDVEMLHTFQQLSAQGKLSTSGGKVYSQMQAGLIRKLGLGKDATPEEILAVLYSKKSYTTNEAAAGVYDKLGEILKAEAGGFKGEIEGLGVGVDTPKHETLGGMLAKELQGTITGANSQQISGFLNSWHNDKYGFDMPKTSREFAVYTQKAQQQGESNEAYEQRLKPVIETYEQELSNQKTIVDIEVDQHRGRVFAGDKNIRKGSIAGRMSKEQVNALKDHATGNFADFLVPLALTFVGAAIGSGDADPQAMQQLVGSTISAFAYARTSFSAQLPGHLPGGMNKGAVIGGALAGSLKFRQAVTNNSGDAAAAMGELFVREAVVGGINAFIAPIATEVATTKLFGVNRMALDSDRYLASKTLAGSAVGAMLSAVSGFFISNYLVAGMKSQPKIVGGGILEATLNSASKRIEEARASQIEASDDVDVTNEDTGESVEADVSTQESFYSDDNSELSQELQGDIDMQPDYYGNYSSSPTNLFRDN